MGDRNRKWGMANRREAIGEREWEMGNGQ